MKRFRRLPGEPDVHRIPRGGPPPDVECPLKGEFVSFEDCLNCEYHIDILESDLDYCLIEKQEKEERVQREQEKLESEVAERNRKWEEEDRKMRSEMADLRDEMERNSKKWEKEYQKEQREYEKLEEERRAMERESLVKLYGEREVEWVEFVLERMKNDLNRDEEEESEEEEEEDNGED